MKQSGPSNKRWLLWWPLLGVGAWLALFGDRNPQSTVEVSLPTRTISSNAASEVPRKEMSSDALMSVASRDQLIPARSTKLHATRDLFSARDWSPPPPAPLAPLPESAPVAPALPYMYLGKKHEAGNWEVYLGRGEQAFVAREGQVLEGIYRVGKIAPPTITLVYLPLGQEQTISIGDPR